MARAALTPKTPRERENGARRAPRSVHATATTCTRGGGAPASRAPAPGPLAPPRGVTPGGLLRSVERTGEALSGAETGRNNPAPRRFPLHQPLSRDASVGPSCRGALVPPPKWVSSRPACRPLPSCRSLVLRSAPPCPTLSPRPLFCLQCQWFLSSAAGWQRFSEVTKKGFIYGKPAHTGTKDLCTRTVYQKSRGALVLLRVFPWRERQRMLTDRLPCAQHFLKVASFHPYSDPSAPLVVISPCL